MKCLILVLALVITAASSAVTLAQNEGSGHSSSNSEEGLGRAHMDTSCDPKVAAEFDRRLPPARNVMAAVHVKYPDDEGGRREARFVVSRTWPASLREADHQRAGQG